MRHNCIIVEPTVAVHVSFDIRFIVGIVFCNDIVSTCMCSIVSIAPFRKWLCRAPCAS